MQAPPKHPRAAQAAAALARALRNRGLVAEESAGADGTARVLIITPAATRLAEQICVTGDSKPWFWWSGQPLCLADDISTAADTITSRPPLRTPLDEGNGR